LRKKLRLSGCTNQRHNRQKNGFCNICHSFTKQRRAEANGVATNNVYGVSLVFVTESY
jgi:nitrate/TMAO reductase-like tetraheme cytochrome c subunit